MPTTNYHTVNGYLVGSTNSGTTTSYLSDALGSIVGLFANNDVSNTYRYKPYGDFLSVREPEPRPAFLWTGYSGSRRTELKYSDQYNRNRHYGTTQAQWTTIDPLWPAELSYAYSMSSPTSFIDPSGLRGSSSSSARRQPITQPTPRQTGRPTVWTPGSGWSPWATPRAPIPYPVRPGSGGGLPLPPPRGNPLPGERGFIGPPNPWWLPPKMRDPFPVPELDPWPYALPHPNERPRFDPVMCAPGSIWTGDDICIELRRTKARYCVGKDNPYRKCKLDGPVTEKVCDRWRFFMRGHQRCIEARKDELRWRCFTDMNPRPLEEAIKGHLEQIEDVKRALKNCRKLYDIHCK